LKLCEARFQKLLREALFVFASPSKVANVTIIACWRGHFKGSWAMLLMAELRHKRDFCAGKIFSYNKMCRRQELMYLLSQLETVV